jgi:hypothetical protein
MAADRLMRALAGALFFRYGLRIKDFQMRKSKQQPRAPRAAPSAAELPPTDEAGPGTAPRSLWDTKAACGMRHAARSQLQPRGQTEWRAAGSQTMRGGGVWY